MNMVLRCDCGDLVASGELRTVMLKTRMFHSVHYSNVLGSFYLNKKDLLFCSKCNGPAMTREYK